MVYDIHMTSKRALVSGRIDKAANRQELSGQYTTVVDTIDPHFNESVLNHLSRTLINTDGNLEAGYTFEHDGTLTR